MLLPQIELRPREEMLHAAKLSWWTQSAMLAIGACLLPIGGVGLLAFAIAWWRVHSVALWVTSQRVVIQQGILVRHRVEVPVHRIDAVSIDQGIIQWFVSIGDLQLSVEGTNRIQLSGMVGPSEVRSAIWRAQVHELR